MRILAIRGKNLASLAGEFDVDFQAEPLASAGLFAICGPTGAGKSTLLDAICLALYEQTPRLVKTIGRGLELPDVGQEKITPHDPRTVLRRGSADGFAEVDFEGSDRIAYRARWSVRRAGGKLSGRLQKTEHSLARISDLQRIGSTNSEVKKEIEQRVGLGFDQFTRSVILAQNEFAAFLKADDNLRGELLETLTGTDIYSDISMRAFERAKQEHAELERLSAQLADQRPLDATQRIALELESTQAIAAVQQLDIARRTLEDQLRWFNELRKLQEDEDAAATVLRNAIAEQASAEARRAALRTTEAAQPARSLVAEHDRLANEDTQAQHQARLALAALDDIRRQRTEAREALDAAAAALLRAEAAEREAIPALNRAKALDAEIATLAPLRDELEKLWQTSLETRLGVENRHRAKQAEHAAACEARQTADAWLAANQAIASLAAGWQGFDIFLTQAREAEAGHAAALTALAGAQEKEDGLAHAQSDTANRQAAASLSLAAAAAKRDRAAAEQAQFDIQHLAAERQRAARRRDAIAQAASIWHALQATAARKAELEAGIGRLQEEIATADAERADAESRHELQQAALAQAEASLRIAQAACGENIERLRETLQTGMPCPVCGSEAHPYRTENPQLHAVMASLQAEIDVQRQRLHELVRRQADMSAAAATARRQCDQQFRDLSAADEERRTAEMQWSACAPADIDAGHPAAWLEENLRTAQAELQTLEAQEAQWQNAVENTRKAQEAHDRAVAEHTAASEAAQAAANALAAFRFHRAALEEKRRTHAETMENTLERLDAAFSDAEWRAQWRASPAGFHQHCRRSAEEWQQYDRQRQELDAQIAGLDITLKAMQEELRKAAQEEENTRRSLDDMQAKLDASRTQRGALFDGKPTAEAEHALREAIRLARQHFLEREKAAQTVHEAHARAETAVEQSRRNLLALQEKAADAARQLAQWLQEFNARWETAFALPELRETLSRGADWISEQKHILQTIETGVQQADAVLAERRMRRLQQEERRPTDEDADAISVRLRALDEEKARAADTAAALRLELNGDDEKKARHARSAQALAEQEARARTWAQLNELIGSADGKKFRNYAQQFTLEVLLAYANRHLGNLSRRYRLERIGATLGLMVIDQDMGDEARSVHSLSGGESFLVSLALALALASLSSDRVSVESLFIDEGFGSLDSETLLVAMDALDQLQSQGRKVGVISHVQEMTERIGTQIQIRRTSGGFSRIIVPGPKKARE